MRQVFVIHLHAVSDLLRRYWAVLRHAWQERKTLDSKHRLAHETEFLPASLELQETPVSPAPRVAMWLIMTFAALALLWSIFGKIDVVATAHGKIVPNDRTKVIQPVETSVVKEINVTDGQFVRSGEVLIELDATNADADSARIANDLATSRLQSARAKALLTSLSGAKAPKIDRLPDVSPERLLQEQTMLEGQYSEYRAKLTRIEADLARREAEFRSTQEVVRKLEQTVPIARQRAKDFADLVDKNFVSRHGYLEKEQIRIEQEADLATQRSRLTELAAAVAEVKAQRVALVAETRRLALDSLSEAEQRATTYSHEFAKSDSRGRLMRLTAPVGGLVQQLAVHTIGGVVTPAQVLMVIVPADDALEVEAFLENKDIGFVDKGQEAEVKVETFPFTKYGTLPAEVIHVSSDAISDEKRGLIYSSRVRLKKTSLQVGNRVVNLSPGMAVTVEIKTDKRRVIEYFLSPLLQYKDESLRER